MTQNDLNTLRTWLKRHYGFLSGSDTEQRKAFELKINHTNKVVKHIARISQAERLNASEQMLAQAVALLHDTGRFTQFARYKTFNDSLSVNHGRLGAQILEEENALGILSRYERDVLTDAVRFHNALSLPAWDDARKTMFLKLIRDADKLDIWEIFIQMYEGRKGSPSPELLGYSDTLGYTKQLALDVLDGRPALLGDTKNLNDLKLVHLSWVYGLNFTESYKILIENNYIKRIAEWLPQDDTIKRLINMLVEFTQKKVKD